MTVTPEDQHPTWPDGDPGKVLLNCVVSLNVDSVFEELFGSYPDTQAKLHKQRSDTNCAESPWVSQRSQLPAQQFVWPAPPAGADPGTPAQGKFRKVRFDAAASLASKAFSSEEVQQVLQYNPGSHYQLLTEVSTTAMYGDTFTVISRYNLVGKGPGRAHLHVAYAIEFKPSLSRLMKPMVAKGVDGGIRGSFSVLKKLLQEQYGLTELPDTAPAPALPGAPAAAAAAAAEAAVPAAAPEAAGGAPMLAVPAGPGPGLLGLADYVVYQELVASLVRVSDPQLMAKALAVCLTLVLVNMLIMLLRPVSQACAAAAAAGTGASSGGLVGWACWPVTVLGFDIPHSLGEVLGALLLVAVANRLLLLAVELVANTLKGSPSPSAAASRAPSMLGAALSAVAAAAATSSPPPATANGSSAAEPQAAAAAAQGSSRADSQAQSGKPGLLSPRQKRSSPVGIPGKAANGAGSGGSGGGGGGSGGGVEAALSSFSNTVTGWGRNLLNGSMVDSLSSNEGIKALVAGPWSKPPTSNDAGQGPGSGAAAAAAAAGGEGAVRLSGAGSGPGPGRAPSHRHTSSFTAVMDPSGLNIIEDYDQQLNTGGSSSKQQQQQQQHPSLPQLAEEHSGAASSPATSDVGVSGSSKAAGAQEGSKGGAGTAGGKGQSLSAAAATGARSSSPNKMKRAGSSKTLLSEGDAEARQPLLSAASVGDDGASVGSQAGSSITRAAGTGAQGAGGSRPSTPAPDDEPFVPPLLDSASPIIVPQRGDKAAQLQQGVRSSKSVTFSRSPNPTDGPSGDPLSGSHSAAALLSAGAGRSAGGAGAVHSSTRSSPLARRSASPMLYGASPPPEVSAAGLADSLAAGGRLRLSGMSASYEALSASSGSSSGGVYAPAVEPGAEEEDEVVVEVFEHERVQPFRGWGHTWPGHFLPSDKVGHWGDRTGAPGGAVSMLFDRVAPRLPPGWTWQDDEWSVDMTGAEWEGCDAEGWSYGMDFSWITWPPGPQMGKPGLKSFVRRRRWLRTRARLPPGVEAPAEDSPSQCASPVLVMPGYDPMQQQQQQGGGSAPSSARDSDGGFMSGLGAGLGLVSHDSATAAAAAAGAMVSRFMKAVQDLPLAPRGSSAGSELGLGTSPPTNAPGAAAAAAAGEAAGEAPATSAAAEAPATASKEPAVTLQDEGEDGAAASSKQQATSLDSKSSNAGSSHRGGESGNVSDSDSSSVNSDSPPPRPRLSEALAELQQAEVAGVPQAAAAEAAAAIAAAAAEEGVQEGSDKDTAAEAAEAGTSSNAAADTETATTAAGAAKGVPPLQDEPGVGVSAEAGDAGSGDTAAAVDMSSGAPDTEAVQVSVPMAPAAAAAAAAVVGIAAATHPDGELQEGLPAVGATEVSGSTPPAAAATGADKPVEVGPVDSPAAVMAPAAEEPAASSGRGTAQQLPDDKQQPHPASTAAGAAAAAEPAAASHPPASATAAADEVVSAGTEQQAVLEGAAAGAGVPCDAAGSTTSAAPTTSGLVSTSSVGAGSAAGSGDWVWSAAAADGASEQAAPSAAQPQQQQGLPTAGESELPSSPTAADREPAGTVRRTSSGAASRGVVRTGSGARGSRGKASKLGAVPLRRSADGAAASSSSGAGAGGGGGGVGSATGTPGAGAASSRKAPALGPSSSGSRAATAAAELAAAAIATPMAPAGVHTGSQPRVSGDDMGSGMGWASSPGKQQQQQQPGTREHQQSRAAASARQQQAGDRPQA